MFIRRLFIHKNNILFSKIHNNTYNINLAKSYYNAIKHEKLEKNIKKNVFNMLIFPELYKASKEILYSNIDLLNNIFPNHLYELKSEYNIVLNFDCMYEWSITNEYVNKRNFIFLDHITNKLIQLYELILIKNNLFKTLITNKHEKSIIYILWNNERNHTIHKYNQIWDSYDVNTNLSKNTQMKAFENNMLNNIISTKHVNELKTALIV